MRKVVASLALFLAVGVLLAVAQNAISSGAVSGCVRDAEVLRRIGLPP